jgi:phage/plasmid-like protein (TIGR03299 family)
MDDQVTFAPRKVAAPWEEFGTDVLHEASPEEMLAISKLDWTVSKRPCFIPCLAGSEDVSQDRIRSADIFALVRDSDNKVFGPAGKEYVPTQNRQVFEFFKKFCAAGNLRISTVGALGGGRDVWVLAKLARTLTLPGGDEVEGYLLFSSPHRWGKALVVKFTTIRVICKNTLAMALNDTTYGKGYRQPHIRPFDSEVAKEVEVTLKLANELFDGFEENSKKLVAAKVQPNVVVRYIADVMSPELVTAAFGKGFYKQSELAQAKLIASPDGPNISPQDFKSSAYEVFQAVKTQPGAELESSLGTMWGAFNGLTHWTDHQAGLSRENAVESAWFGPKSVLKTKAFKRAIQVAEASTF